MEAKENIILNWISTHHFCWHHLLVVDWGRRLQLWNLHLRGVLGYSDRIIKTTVEPVTVLNFRQSINQTLQQLFAWFIQRIIKLTVAFYYNRHFFYKCNLSSWIFTQPEVTLDNVLQKALGWLLELGLDHEVKHVRDCEVPLRLHTQVFKTLLVHKDLLYDECGYSLWQFGAPLHYSKTQGNYFCFNQKVDHFGIVHLDQSTYHTQWCQSQVLKRSSLANRIQKGKSIKMYVGLQKQLSCVLMRRNALQHS